MRQFPTILFAILAGFAGAPLHAWTPTTRPGFKLDTLRYSNAGGSYHRVACYDSLGRITDSAEWTVQTNGVTDYIRSWQFLYEGGSARFTKRIHFDGTPTTWYTGTRTVDTGYVRRDHEGRDSCMDVSGTKIGSYGTVGGGSYKTIAASCAIRWDASGRKTYDATGTRPVAFVYDAKGNVIIDTEWFLGTDGRLRPYIESYRYDDQGRLASVFRSTDTAQFSYTPEGWLSYSRFRQNVLVAWDSLKISGDTAKYVYHGDFEGGSGWFIKDHWGDTIEEMSANGAGRSIERDSLTRDASGNVVLARHFTFGPTDTTQGESTRFVWSPSRAETGVRRAVPMQPNSVTRIEWIDVRGNLLGASNQPRTEPIAAIHRASTGPVVVFERSFDRDGKLVSSRRILIPGGSGAVLP